MRYFKLIVTFLAIAALSHSSVAMKATVDVFRFQADDKPYVEIFMYVVSNSVTRTATNNYSVEVKYFIYRDTNVVAGDKYNLVIPEGTDAGDFMDIRRHYLDPGKYFLKVHMRDNNNPLDMVILEDSISIPDNAGSFGMSDIQLLSNVTPSQQQDKWTKHGIRAVPLPFNFVSEDVNTIQLYSELYGSDRILDEAFYVQYSIAPIEQPERIVSNTYEKLDPAGTNPLFHQVDISHLTSSTYVLTLGAYDRERNLLQEVRALFSKSNPEADMELLENIDKYFEFSFTQKMDEDSLRYVLKALAPRVSDPQVGVLNYLIRKGGVEEQRKFIHQFWLEMDVTGP